MHVLRRPINPFGCMRDDRKAKCRRNTSKGQSTISAVAPLSAPARVGGRALRSVVGGDRLTETREIAPYLWVHPDEER
jgi:hypothetical protein